MVVLVLLQELESNREMATGERKEDHGPHENACTLKFETILDAPVPLLLRT